MQKNYFPLLRASPRFFFGKFRVYPSLGLHTLDAACRPGERENEGDGRMNVEFGIRSENSGERGRESNNKKARREYENFLIFHVKCREAKVENL
jgi:hypothetical protein